MLFEEMTYQYIVSDASLLLCLMKAGMLDVLFRLPWQNYTTDCVLSELRGSGQRALLNKFAREKRLKVWDFLSRADEVRKVPGMQMRHSARLTIAECSAYMLAENLHCPLLTTDRRLRLIAGNNVEVYGLRFVIDQCVNCGALDDVEALSAMERLLACNPALLSAEEMIMKTMDAMT